MATEVLELVIRTSGASTASGEIDRMTKSSNALTGALRFMRNALVALSFGRAALGIVGLLDSFIQMQNKLALVTRGTEEVNVAIEALAEIAIRSRTPLDVTTTLFTRMNRSLTQLHLTYGELLDITEATNKALVISGATTDEARNAIIQFTQGLALGVLRGQDLRSVVEFAPRLAQVLADGLSKSTPIVKQFGENFKLAGGQLYSFVTAHKNILTAEIAINAYKDALKELNIEFDKTKPTIQQAFTNLTTAVEIFIGRASQANGVVAHLVDAIDFVRLHLNAFAEGLVLIGGLLVFNFLARQIIAFGSVAFSVLRTVVSGFGALGSVIARVGITGSVFLRSFLGLAVVGLAIYAVVEAFQYFGITINDVIDFFERFVASIETQLQVLGKLFSAIWDSFLEGAITSFNFISAKFTEFLNHFRAENQKPFALNVGTAAGGGERLAGFFNGKEMAADAGLFEKNLAGIKATVGDIQGYFNKLGQGGVTKEMIDKFRALQSALSGTSSNLKTTKDDTEAATASLLAFLRQISPYAAAKAKIAELDAKIAAAVKKNVDVEAIWAELGFGQIEANRRLAREVLGVGNALPTYTENVKLINEALATHNIMQDEATERLRKVRLEYLAFGRDISTGVETSLKTFDDTLAHQEKITSAVIDQVLDYDRSTQLLVVQLDALTDAQKRGIGTDEKRLEVLRQLTIASLQKNTGSAVSGVEVAKLQIDEQLANRNKITADATTQALASKTAFSLLKVQTEGLNEAMRSGTITGEQYNSTLRDLEITALQTSTNSADGFRLGMLQVQKQLAETAQASAQVVTDMFNGMTDALTNFFVTGKLGLGDLVRSVESALVKMAVQSAIIKPLAGFLGVGGEANGGGGGGGLSSFLGGLTGGGGGAAGGGIGNFLFGSGGGVSGLGSLLGFASGGSFDVGGVGPTDSQVVAFRASPNERVTVETPDQQGMGGSKQNIKLEMHLHGVQDYDSFKRSEGQIYSRAAGRLQRAASRNG